MVLRGVLVHKASPKLAKAKVRLSPSEIRISVSLSHLLLVVFCDGNLIRDRVFVEPLTYIRS